MEPIQDDWFVTAAEADARTRVEHLAVPRAAVRVLAACATNASLTPYLPLDDPWAADVVQRLGCCVNQFTNTELRHSALRAWVIDELAQRFFAETPGGIGVGAWSILGTRGHRLGDARWIDLDAPAVAKLRRHCLPERTGWIQASACLCCSPWANALRGRDARGFLFVLDEAVIPIQSAALVHFLDEVSRVGRTGWELIVAFDQRAAVRPVVRRSRCSAAELVVQDASGAPELIRYPRLRFVDADAYSDDLRRAFAGANAVAGLHGGSGQPALAHLTIA
jgi:hypothetical protein